MHTSKKIIALLLLLIAQQNIFAEQNVAETTITYDPRALGIIFLGVTIAGIGLTFFAKGCMRMINGREKGEVNAQESTFNQFTAETLARIGGAGTTLVGVITTASGFLTIVSAKEIILQLEKFINQHR